MATGSSSTPQDSAPGALYCDHISQEYEKAIELIERVRNGIGQAEQERVRHWSLPASKISADFFCTAEHRQNGWFGFLADSAGHGLASAIFALHTPMLFRESVLLGSSLAVIHERINRFLIRQHISNYFVCGVLVRVQGREIEVINAGLPDALLLGAGELIERFPSQNLPFGIDPDYCASAQHYHLACDDSAALLLYSDGLTDIGALSGQALGLEGVQAIAVPAGEEAFTRLVDQVLAHSEDAHDDITITQIAVPLATLSAERAEPPPLTPIAGAASEAVDVAAVLRIVEHFDHGLLITDADQQILYVNPAFTAITGYSLSEAIGQTPRLLSAGRHDAEFYREMWQSLLSKGSWSGEIWNRRKDGGSYLEWLDIRAVRDEAGTITNFLGTFTVMGQHALQEEHLRDLTLHDHLTGLANRVLLADRGEQALHRANRSGRPLAVLFIDLDRFTSINESLGHDIGDQVLQKVSQRLSKALREDDTLSRFVGDEFVCLLPELASRDDAALVAAKLLGALESPIEVAGHRFKVGASIGISTYPVDARLFDDLLVLAERAKQGAKQSGGNLVRIFSAEMHGAGSERQLEQDARLDAAIRNGELELHYQPKLDLQTHTVVGAEALVRWRDPQRGLLAPAAFIPVAEKSDLIAKLGQWVLHEACAALARWHPTLPQDFRMAINVSPLQLVRSNLAEEIAAALDACAVPPARLQLEITESLFIRNPAEAARTLEEIASLGVSIALDDFGTGYSNLSTLHSLPLDTFKLDQSFVRDIDRRPTSTSIAKAVWHMADELEKKVVAEGVETCDECLKVKALGYHIGQGYKYGRPMSEGDFVSYLENWRPENCRCPS